MDILGFVGSVILALLLVAAHDGGQSPLLNTQIPTTPDFESGSTAGWTCPNEAVSLAPNRSCLASLAANTASLVYVTFDFPGATQTAAFGINAGDEMVGQYIAGGIPHGFLLKDDGTFVTIDFPGSDWNQARGINARGQIVGEYRLNGQHAFRYHRGVYTAIDFRAASLTVPAGINDRGDIVGYYSVGGTRHGYLRDKYGVLTTIDYPGGASTELFGINNRRQVGGAVRLTPGADPVGFTWDEGTFTLLDPPPGAASYAAAGINASGNIVGSYTTPAGQTSGCFLAN
jgi:YD repeat-containing protein